MTLVRYFLTLFLVVGLYFKGYSQYDSISFNSVDRTYLLNIPPSYVPENPVPLVVAMHGGFGSGPQLQIQSQLSVKADNEGFIVVYPEGVKSPFGIRTWNAGGCCGYAMNNNIDDVGFLTALIDTLIADYSIDTNRVYASGMSNGAFMSYRLACEKSNKIAAIAPVAGTMNLNTCAPVRGVPVIHFHSYQDENIPYDGGIGSGFSNHYNPPLDSVLNVWSNFSNCNIQNDTLQYDTDYTHINWSGCDCGNELHLYLTQDGGHSWPGGVASSTGDPASNVINANDLMWDFFQQHSLNCSVTGIQAPIEENYLEVYPNPFKKSATIELNREIFNGNIVIRNILGRKVKNIQVVDKNNFILHRDYLSAGLYFLQLIEKGELVSTNKIIIID